VKSLTEGLTKRGGNNPSPKHQKPNNPPKGQKPNNNQKELEKIEIKIEIVVKLEW